MVEEATQRPPEGLGLGLDEERQRIERDDLDAARASAGLHEREHIRHEVADIGRLPSGDLGRSPL